MDTIRKATFPFSGGYIEGDATNYGCVVAPVYLPNGVLITDMFVSVYDDDPGRGITVNLRRVNNFSGVTDTMASVSTTVTGTFSGIEVLNDNSIDEPQTVYPDYSYYVTTCVLLIANSALFGAFVFRAGSRSVS